MRTVLPDPTTPACAHWDAHPGLVLERYAPLGPDFKVPDDLRKGFAERVCAVRVPDVYRQAYGRWQAALCQSAWTIEVQATTRILIGSGNPAPLEVGISLLPVYGVPFLPGTALKGLLNHYLAERLGSHASDTADRDSKNEWNGVAYDPKTGRPTGAPGQLHRALFGGPAIPDANDDGYKGHVVFEDAWYVPKQGKTDEADCPLVPDVLTPHHKDYYRENGGQWPNDWDDPVPVQFITVRPHSRFLLALSGDGQWPRWALEQLVHALEREGIGAKTAAGYGRLVPCDASAGPRPPQPPPRPRPRHVEAALAPLEAAVAAVKGAEGNRTEVFRGQDWDGLLRQCLPICGAEAVRDCLEPILSHPKLKKRAQAELDALRALIAAGETASG